MSHSGRGRVPAVADAVAAVCLAALAVVPRPGIGVATAVLIMALFVGWGSRGLRRGGTTFAAMSLFQGSALAATALGATALGGSRPPAHS